MANHTNHPFHIIEQSSWPLTGITGTLVTVTGITDSISTVKNSYLLLLLLFTLQMGFLPDGSGNTIRHSTQNYTNNKGHKYNYNYN
jgi:hypothetical protein